MGVYALRLSNGADTAARVRMGDLLGLTPNGNLGARSGIRPGPTAGDVAVSSGTMNVTVQPFLAFIDGAVSDAQGGYPFVCDTVQTLALAAGHASLARTDVVAAVVRDNPFDSSGSVTATVEVVQGTPGSGVPTLPANALPLRNVVVPAGASSGTGGLSSGALSTDRRTWLSALGGVVPVASATERDTLTAYDGLQVYLQDVDVLQLRRNGAWVPVGGLGGNYAHVYTGATQTQTAHVDFPVAFAAAPTSVTVSCGDERFTVAAKNITATGFDVTSYYLLGNAVASFTMTVHWNARA